MKFRLLFLVALSGTAFGQAVSYHSNVTQTGTNVPFGASAPVMTTPNALISVCSYPPTGTPCTNTVAIFQDQAMAVPFTQPLTSDPKGRFDFWAPAGQYFISVQTASGANVGGYPQALGGSGGSGGSPGGVPFNAQYQVNSTTFGGSKATFDAAGNFNSLSLDGLKNAFLNQSAAGANNGIQRSLQTIGNYVVAGNDYPCTESNYSTPYRNGIGAPAPFADATWLQDRRGACGLLGDYVYNQYFGPSTLTWKYDRWISNHLPNGGAVNQIPFHSDFEMTGSGINGFEGGGPDSTIFTQWNNELMTRGIITPFNFVQQNYSLGDNHIWQNFINNNRGSTDGSGEGFNTVRNQINQNLTPMVTTAITTLAAGATLIPGTLISTNVFPGDGTYYIDFTKGSAIFKITAATNPGGTSAGIWTVTSTLTPDNIGRVAAAVSTPVQRYGATTNETVTVTGLTSALVTTQTVCVADPAYQESARVINAGSFSGGTATGVVLALRYVHQAAAYVAQGSHACNLVESRGNQLAGSSPSRQLFRIIGALDAHHMYYSRTVFGNWNPAPSGFSTTNFVASAGATLTRDGSNLVTVAVTDPFLQLTNDIIGVSGCSDTSFNGLFGLTFDNGSAVQWPNTGPAATTTCTSDVEILSRRNTIGAREAQEFPGAEIVNTVDPVTFANNYNISVEPNTNFQVTAGDQLENHPYSDVIMGFDHNLMNFQSQNSASISSILHFDQIGEDIPEGTTWERIAFTDDPVHYQGLGGTKKISNVLFDMSNNRTPWGALFLNMPTPSGQVFSFKGCLYGCADARSKFSLFSWQTNNGFYDEQVHQDNGLIQSTDQNTTTAEISTEARSPLGWVFTVSAPAGSDQFSMGPGGTSNQVSGSGLTSHVSQTSSSFASDVPITVPYLIPTLAVAPTGSCTSVPNGTFVATLDGHMTSCAAGTWTSRW